MRLWSLISLSVFGFIQGAHGAVTGAYLGPTLGFGTISGHYTSTSNAVAAKIAEKKKKHTSFLGGLVAGWGFRSNCLFAGVEVEGLLDRADQKYLTDRTFGRETFKFKHHYQYGAALRFGYATVSNLLIYARLGLAGGKWSQKYRAKDLDGTSVASKSSHVHKVTFAPGVGAEMMIGSRFSVRGEVRYTPAFDTRFKIKEVPNSVVQFESTTMRSKFSQLSCMFSVLVHL